MCLKNKIIAIFLGTCIAGISIAGINIQKVQAVETSTTQTTQTNLSIEQLEAMVKALQQQIQQMITLITRLKPLETCGNGICRFGENAASCPADCVTHASCIKKGIVFQEANKQCCSGLKKVKLPSTCDGDSPTNCASVLSYTCQQDNTSQVCSDLCEAKGYYNSRCSAWTSEASDSNPNAQCKTGEINMGWTSDCNGSQLTSSNRTCCCAKEDTICTPKKVSGCNVCNSTGTKWVSTDSKCASGQICRNGKCVTVNNEKTETQDDSCANECETNGAKQCSGTGYQTCGNHDSDSCLEWSTVNACENEGVCSNGACYANSLKHCAGTGYQFCRIYENDKCSQWSDIISCPTGQTCANGVCFLCQPRTISGCKVCDLSGVSWSDDNSKCASGQTCRDGQCVNTSPSCTNECASSGAKQCSGNGFQICGDYDNDNCLEWSTITACTNNQTCLMGNCAANCIAKTCASEGYICGNLANGCGTTLNCGSCSGNQTCKNGKCVNSCQANSYKACYNNDVYWYDSCGTRGALYDDCTSQESCTTQGTCTPAIVIKKSNGEACTSNIQCASGICKEGFGPGYSGFCQLPCTYCWPSN